MKSQKEVVTKESPGDCEWCGETIANDFVDGRTKHGSWADMCLACHGRHGVGLGVGKGQRYQRGYQSVVFVKVEG